MPRFFKCLLVQSTTHPLEAVACSCARRFRCDFGDCTRYDWRIDCRPATNIDRRDVVDQSRVTARHTGKNALALAIGFVNMPTLWASAARVAGVNQHHQHTGPLGFVGDKRPQLKERPAMQGGPLSATNRYPDTPFPGRISRSNLPERDRVRCLSPLPPASY